MTLTQIWSERRRIILFALLIILAIVVLARQSDLIPPGPAGRVVRTAVHPLVATVAAVDRQVTNLWVTMFHARALREENRRLREEISELRASHQLLANDYERLQRLTGLTAGQPVSDLSNVAANVIGRSPNFWSRTMTIDRGMDDGITTGMPVINKDGLVGVVRDITKRDALVQLLVDSEFAAGALTSGTRDRGIVQGTGEVNRLVMILDNPQTPVQAGVEVLTSGQPAQSLFPKGFIIGKITGVQPNKFGQPTAVIQPCVRFDRLEEVVVLRETRHSESSDQQLPLPPP